MIERRVNVLGVSEPIVQTNKTSSDDYRVIVELAGVFDVNQAKSQIGETPLLEFRELDETAVSVPADESTAIAEAQSALDRALAGEDFESLARELSQDPGSAENGGDLGFVLPGVFVPEFDEVLFNENFETGTVWPELVETAFGWHVIKKENERVENGQTEVQGRHILIRRPNSNEQQWVNTELTGKNLKRAVLSRDQFGTAQVNLEFDDDGAEMFATITERNVGRPVAIFLDGSPISTPVVQQKIIGGSAVISGQFSLEEAQLLAQRLNAGALPVPIELISQQTVGSSLGNQAVADSLQAGIYGLILLALFMLIYYRVPGLISVIALAFYAVFVLALFKLMGVTLTLAGIAGFILSLGLAVDANVLIFERMKEELQDGHDLTDAIETGFTRAWSSIRDSNISSLLTALILYWFGTSIIKGFAVTLSMGILISMFTAIVVTRTFLRLLPHRKEPGWMFGVNKKRIKT